MAVKKTGLGKGLDSLITDKVSKASAAPVKVEKNEKVVVIWDFSIVQL